MKMIVPSAFLCGNGFDGLDSPDKSRLSSAYEVSPISFFPAQKFDLIDHLGGTGKWLRQVYYALSIGYRVL